MLTILFLSALGLITAGALANVMVKRRRRRALHVRLVMDPIRKLRL